MEDTDGTYAPQSPDLSEYQSLDQINQQYPSTYYPPQQRQQSAYQPPYQQTSNFDPFAPDHSSYPLPTSYQQLPMMPDNRHVRTPNAGDDDYAPEPSAPKSGSGRRSKKQKIEEEICDKPAPGTDEGIEVKTKFPVARIKRIMQADEDVGKVSQVTPPAVSKALELFMISVVTKAAKEARAKQAKRVTAAHLKQAVQNDDQMDFLVEILAKVPDAPALKKKEETEDSEEMGEGKRKRKVGARRKKAKDDDDF